MNLSISTYLKALILPALLMTLSCHTSNEFSLKDQRPIQVFDKEPYFISFALDLAQIAGGKWWEGSDDFSMGRGGKKAIPFNFKREKLLKLAEHLSPFILRAGGSEADSIYYQFNDSKAKSNSSYFQTTLTKKIWNDLYQFSTKNGNKLLFTLNVGPGYRTEGVLDTAHLHHLFKFIKDSGQSVDYFELGNELNAFFLNYGFSNQVDEDQYAYEYRKVKAIMKTYFPNALLLGPANAWWPHLGEVFNQVAFSSEKLLSLLLNNSDKSKSADIDIFSWHYYPTQSKRCPIAINKSSEYSMRSYKTLNAIESIFFKIRKMTKTEENSLKVWLGESGPAQCGGEPGVSKSFSSALWWVDHVARVASSINEVLIRQTLSGSDYGIIDDKTLKVSHDYISTLIFKRLAITKALKFSSAPRGNYYFCSKDNALIQLMVNVFKKKKEVIVDDYFIDSNVLEIDEAVSRDLIDFVDKTSQIPVFGGQKLTANTYRQAPLSYTYIIGHKPHQYCL